MQLRISLALSLLVLVGCRTDGGGPVKPLAAALAIVATPPTTAEAGAVAGTFTVKVTDQTGAALSGSVVTFTVSLGGARVSPATDTTKADGTASTTLTVGTTPGANEVTAVVSGVAPVKFALTGVAGVTKIMVIAPRSQRLPLGQDNATISAIARDTFFNATGGPITWTSRNPALVSVTPAQTNTATVAVVSRPGQTYVVAASGATSDSVLVSVQDGSSTPCTFAATPTVLPIGGSLAFDAGLACIRSTELGAEYIVVAHYNTAVTLVSARLEVTGTGITTPPAGFPSAALVASLVAPTQPQRDVAFERALRSRERREIGSHVAAARAWYRAAHGAPTKSAMPALQATLREGDLVTVNVNAQDFCSNPKNRTARVVAITNGAVVMADVNNPTGGFTDAEYRAFGVTMDTLVNPVDTTAFGAPGDVDGNNRVGILFTSAVNELTSAGSGAIVLGFYYIRDLLPKESPFGNCPGSNVSEMFYVLVPDPSGTVNSNARTKSFVEDVVIGTIGHEYQHLINASRRMYVTEAPQVDEEVWLNEGLSHVAEELLFYRVSGLSPRQNIGASQLGMGSLTRTAFDIYQRGNFGRYRDYLRAPETNSPIARNDVLATRGATWSFLRYLADRTRATDGDFWHRLVNSKLIGVPNLDALLNDYQLTTLGAMSDWSVSVLTDDLVSNGFQQPSWNFLTALPAVGLGTPYPLVPRPLTDRSPTVGVLPGGASAYLHFGVPQNQEALLQVNGTNSGPIAPGVRLTVVRIK